MQERHIIIVLQVWRTRACKIFTHHLRKNAFLISWKGVNKRHSWEVCFKSKAYNCIYHHPEQVQSAPVGQLQISPKQELLYTKIERLAACCEGLQESQRCPWFWLWLCERGAQGGRSNKKVWLIRWMMRLKTKWILIFRILIQDCAWSKLFSHSCVYSEYSCTRDNVSSINLI